MGTVSTRSNKKNRKARARERTEARGAVEVSRTDSFPDRVWLIGVVVILVVAAVLRLYDLDLVPLHHDEGVNGNFLVRLVREGAYRYDPENYHGPTLYYFSAIIPWITKVLFGSAARDNYGLTTFMIRLVPVVFGLGTIALVFPLRRNLGSVGTLAAGLMLAVSPGAVYLSRYYIHETLFVFFTLGIVVSIVRFYEDRKPSYLVYAGASAALLLATKETSVISIAVLITALLVALIYIQFYRSVVRQDFVKAMIWISLTLFLAAYLFFNSSFLTNAQGLVTKQTAFIAIVALIIALVVDQKSIRRYIAPRGMKALIDEMGGKNTVFGMIMIALTVFLSVYLLFYSSFLTNNQGIYDSLRTFEIWKKTGEQAHVHPFLQYVWWLLAQEGTLLFLGSIGAAIVLLRPKSFLALITALWAFGLIAAYSLIGYKTPWLVLNFVVPLALIAGYALQAIYELDGEQVRLVSVFLLIVIGIATYQSIDLNFINYDNDNPKYVYVYAHTKRGMIALVDEVDRIAKEQSGTQTGITIVSPDYWPLPWYFRNYPRVGYFGRISATTEPIIIARSDQKTEIERGFGEVYRQVPSKASDGSFELRPGVSLLLYERKPATDLMR